MTITATARKTFQMLENESLWTVASKLHDVLSDHKIPYAIVGGVAVCLHGYRRNTVDVDVLIRTQDTQLFLSSLESNGFEWFAKEKEFHSPSGIAVQVLIAGESAGRSQPVKLPDPQLPRVVSTIEGLSVVSLSKLIEMKLACGLGDLRRTHKDFADVVELIAIHQLNGSFARFLHKSVRDEFRALVRRVADSE